MSWLALCVQLLVLCSCLVRVPMNCRPAICAVDDLNRRIFSDPEQAIVGARVPNWRSWGCCEQQWACWSWSWSWSRHLGAKVLDAAARRGGLVPWLGCFCPCRWNPPISFALIPCNRRCAPLLWCLLGCLAATQPANTRQVSEQKSTQNREQHFLCCFLRCLDADFDAGHTSNRLGVI